MDTVFVALRVFVSLAAVLGVLWYAQRRLTRGSRAAKTADLITVVGRQGLGLKASIVMVEVDGTRFLLGVTEHAVNVLHHTAHPHEDSPAGAEAFAASMDEGPENTDSTVLRLRPRDRNSSPAAGSILSPATWKQTATALRQLK